MPMINSRQAHLVPAVLKGQFANQSSVIDGYGGWGMRARAPIMSHLDLPYRRLLPGAMGLFVYWYTSVLPRAHQYAKGRQAIIFISRNEMVRIGSCSLTLLPG